MPDEKVKVEHVINSLKHIEQWCGILAKALEGVRDTELSIPPEDMKLAPRVDASCKPH